MILRKKSPKFIELSDHFAENDEKTQNQREEEAFQRDFYLSKVIKLLDMLKEEQKICLKLFFLKKKTYREVSIETGIPINQVKSNIQNGKRNLKTYFQKIKSMPYEDDTI